MGTPAPVWRRVAAGCCYAILAGTLSLLGMAFGVLPSATLHPPSDWFLTDWWVQLWLDQPRQIVIPITVGACLHCLVTIVFEHVTLGPNAWLCLQIVDESGDEPTLQQWIRRFFGTLLSVAALGLGFAWVLVSRHHRSWHDIVSGTTVILTHQPRHPS